MTTTNQQQRGTPNDEKPFCWQSKFALRKIRESFDAEKTVASALGVYCALTEIASDMQTETFKTTHAYIAQKSGLSPRTVQERLAGLAEIELVVIETPQLKAPSMYRLLSVQQSLPNDTQPLPDVQQRTKKAPLPTLEESKEESKEEKEDIVSADADDLEWERDCHSPASGFDSQKLKDFYKPTLKEVFEFAKEAGLDCAVSVNDFMWERLYDGWIPLMGHWDDWKACLMDYCEKHDGNPRSKKSIWAYLNDRT